jgi:hypothetical protein
MFASLLVYACGVVLLIALPLVVRPLARLRVTRRRALGVAAVALLVAIGALMAPAFESRTAGSARIDQFTPVWQFHEVHTLRVAAPPARVFEAIMKVRADEIRLFHTLTWIRRGGRPAPASILNAGSTDSIIGVATRTGFVRLAEDAPRELVIGTVVVAPPGTRGRLTPDVFQRTLPPGFALVTMNFRVTPDGPDGSVVSTETRVFANSSGARRRFAVYWRLIYPGSAIIRRMWLGAIERRALTG